MHYVQAGSGPLLLLLHGFPEFWYSWRHQIAALSAHFTVVAPDLRGYNETDKPTWGYELDVLTTDVAMLIEALGQPRAFVAGHDWGGVLAWMLAITRPHCVERLITLNMPHPARFRAALRANPRQIARSIYVSFFQLPWLPEQLMRANDYAFIDYALRGQAVRKTTFSDEDIQMYKDAISKPGALTAALNWYRGLRRLPDLDDKYLLVHVPTLMIWGKHDAVLGVELTYDTAPYVPGGLQIRYIPNCSHWVQQEAPELVNQYMRAFLADRTPTTGK
jgi:pimeloyl-ACP methyl ester carboxylesterase